MVSYLTEMRSRVNDRLQALYDGFAAMKERGLPVQAIASQGAIDLASQFDLIGKGGLKTNDDVRKMLLERAGFAVVPFQAFGLKEDTGWFRLSVGAVSVQDIKEAMPRVEEALKSVP